MRDCDWEAEYEAWQNKTKEEFKEKFPHLQDCNHVEICEDGSVYLGGGMWLAKNSVTPWKEPEDG